MDAKNLLLKEYAAKLAKATGQEFLDLLNDLYEEGRSDGWNAGYGFRKAQDLEEMRMLVERLERK